MKFRHVLCAAGAAGAYFLSGAQAVHAAVDATWGTGSGTWSSTETAGWSPSVPDAVGDSGTYDSTGKSSVTTTQELPGSRTVGKLEVKGSAAGSWSIALNSGRNLIVNEDGAGPGAAVLSNTQTVTGGTAGGLIITNGSGIISLNDDLLISNTGTSNRTSGSIQIDAQLQGAGNITFYNVSNNVAAGQIALFRTAAGASTFSGNVNIAKGAVTFNRGDRFAPSTGNVITIGRAGDGSATLAYSGASLGAMENNFAAAADTGGTSVFGTTAAATGVVHVRSTNTNAAAFTLHGDLSFSSAAGLLQIGNRILGAGELTKIGAGPMRVTNANTYAGGTVVDLGSLAVGNGEATSNQFGAHDATLGTLGTGDVTVNATATLLEIESGVNDAIADTATVSLAGGGTPDTADFGYLLLGSGVNESVGALILGGVPQLPGTYGSSDSGATFQSNQFFSGFGVLTVVPEPASLAVAVLGGIAFLTRRRRA